MPPDTIYFQDLAKQMLDFIMFAKIALAVIGVASLLILMRVLMMND